MTKLRNVDYNKLNNLTDEELCQIAAQGSWRAEEILIERYTDTVKQVAHPFYITGGSTEDLVQEGMIGLLAAIRHYQTGHDAKFKTYAELLIRRRLYNVIRDANREKNTPLNEAVSLEDQSEEELIQFTDTPEKMLLDQESSEELAAEIAGNLSKMEQKVLHYYLQGHSYDEIAEKIGKEPKAVDNAVQRIRKKWRSHSSGEIGKGRAQ